MRETLNMTSGDAGQGYMIGKSQLFVCGRQGEADGLVDKQQYGRGAARTCFPGSASLANTWHQLS
jgi:hypothetical protein